MIRPFGSRCDLPVGFGESVKGVGIHTRFSPRRSPAESQEGRLAGRAVGGCRKRSSPVKRKGGSVPHPSLLSLQRPDAGGEDDTVDHLRRTDRPFRF